MSVSYQDWFRKYNSGIFPTANTTIVINSFLGSNTRYSSSAFTMRMSDSFATIGVSVVFNDRSYRQDFKASTHSMNTSFSIFPLSSSKAASRSESMSRILDTKSANTVLTGGFKYSRFSSTEVRMSSLRRYAVVIMDSAVSSSDDTSFLKWDAVSLMYQNGRNKNPHASTGTRKTFPIMTAMAAPAANSRRDAVHKSGNSSSLSVVFKISCTSSISLRK